MKSLTNYIKVILLVLIVVMGTEIIGPDAAIAVTIVTIVVLFITIVTDIFYSEEKGKWKSKHIYQVEDLKY